MSNVYFYICTKTTSDVVLPPVAFDQREYNRRISNTFKALVGGNLEVGQISTFALSTGATNHLLCDGTAVDRAGYPELFKYLGTSQGAGDGSTTFNLPDYRGATPFMPLATPTQTVSAGGTVSTGGTVTTPTTPGQTGGTSGGNVVSGGRPLKGLLIP